MSRTAYIYSDRGGTAALHLLDTTALSYCTRQDPTVWAGADSIRVELSHPHMLSTGEQILWELVCALVSPGDASLDLHEMAAVLDADTLAAVHQALAMAWGVNVSEVSA